VKGGVMPSGGELWTTNCRVRDDMAAQWEQILSAAYVPWTVAIAEHSLEANRARGVDDEGAEGAQLGRGQPGIACGFSAWST